MAISEVKFNPAPSKIIGDALTALISELRDAGHGGESRRLECFLDSIDAQIHKNHNHPAITISFEINE